MPPPSRRPPPVDVDVVRVDPQPGNFVRVTLTGPALADFEWPGAASHLKLLPSGTVTPVVDGVAGRSPSRTYTPRSLDPGRQTLELDVLLHGTGVASEWVTNTGPGDHVKLSRPRASYLVDSDTPALLLAGDDSAVPAMATILEAFPNVPTSVLLETVSSPSDRPELPTRSNLAVDWIDADTSSPGAALEAALRDRHPGADETTWVACEAVAVRRIRAHLLDVAGVPPERLVTRGYWRLGAANHPDHDFGEEPIEA